MHQHQAYWNQYCFWSMSSSQANSLLKWLALANGLIWNEDPFPGRVLMFSRSYSPLWIIEIWTSFIWCFANVILLKKWAGQGHEWVKYENDQSSLLTFRFKNSPTIHKKPLSWHCQEHTIFSSNHDLLEIITTGKQGTLKYILWAELWAVHSVESQ